MFSFSFDEFQPFSQRRFHFGIFKKEIYLLLTIYLLFRVDSDCLDFEKVFEKEVRISFNSLFR